MPYVDGYLLPLPKKNIAAYRKLARAAGRVWLKHGALEYRECVGEDLDTQCGRPFPKVARVGKGETVVFSWIVYRSRKHRDEVNAKVMNDPWMAKMTPKGMPFDFKKISMGGFDVLVEG
jgi:uncharacterized protein YbaA (DUF1428 family)